MATAKPENVEYRHRLKFASEIQYTIAEHSQEDVESPNYFHTLSGRYLDPGDIVHVCVTSDKGMSWAKAVFEIVSVTKTTTLIGKLSDWRVGGAAALAKPKPTRKAA